MPATVGVRVVLPLVACAPVQTVEAGTLDAVQPVASIDDQVSVVELPRGIDAAANESVGTTSAESA